MLIDHEYAGLGDMASVAVLMASLMNVVPAITAVLTLIWVALRIYESKTVQRLLGRKKHDKGCGCSEKGGSPLSAGLPPGVGARGPSTPESWADDPVANGPFPGTDIGRDRWSDDM